MNWAGSLEPMIVPLLHAATTRTLDSIPAMEFAIVCGVAAAVGCGWLAVGTWRTWRRVDGTREAATVLVDLHRDRLDATLVTLSHTMAGTAERGAGLATGLGALRDDVITLRWLLGRIPWERARLRAEVIDLVLPIGLVRDDAGTRADEDSSHEAGSE